MTSVRLGALAASVACASLWAASASAQVYRIVGPDGKVTFSDRPPADAKASPAPSVPMASGGGATGTLPAELRSVASRYPVTLYTSSDCAPCDTARNFLRARGIPFTERTVNTDADGRAFQTLSGSNALPFATLGQQHLKGFAQGEWAQYLELAGYPKTSQLPAGYRNPPPAPLVAMQAPKPVDPNAAQADATDAPRAPAASSAPSAPGPSNPAGIRF